MLNTRTSGILLHPTSLPGPHGIGSLGPAAYGFVDFLAEAGQQVWQVLPLNPTGYGDSPYQSFCTFAGNPLLVSPDLLAQDGLLAKEDLADAPDFGADRVDYGAAIAYKRGLLDKAWQRLHDGEADNLRGELAEFCTEQVHWLDDYALFMALKDRHGGVWTDWPAELSQREQAALEAARHELARPIAAIKFAQFAFDRQWRKLRAYANEKGVRILGDIPIYVAHDSVDVWAHREMFQLDEAGNPTVVAGVPPDYFSATGQLWGNPIYRWDYLADTGYAWWVDRMKAALRRVDFVRLDHFRGFEAYWEVPAKDDTAMNGRWVAGPRDWMFDTFKYWLDEDLPIVAENLGLITEEVEDLRRRFALPGMAVFQFGFGQDAASSSFPLHAYTRDLVAYTGTHDNDTLAGWWKSLANDPESRAMRDYIKSYLHISGRHVHRDVIRALMASTANTVVFPLQDVLGLGTEARMNHPGKPAGNWTWRVTAAQLEQADWDWLRELTALYGRDPAAEPEKTAQSAHTAEQGGLSSPA